MDSRVTGVTVGRWQRPPAPSRHSRRATSRTPLTTECPSRDGRRRCSPTTRPERVTRPASASRSSPATRPIPPPGWCSTGAMPASPFAPPTRRCSFRTRAPTSHSPRRSGRQATTSAGRGARRRCSSGSRAGPSGAVVWTEELLAHAPDGESETARLAGVRRLGRAGRDRLRPLGGRRRARADRRRRLAARRVGEHRSARPVARPRPPLRRPPRLRPARRNAGEARRAAGLERRRTQVAQGRRDPDRRRSPMPSSSPTPSSPREPAPAARSSRPSPPARSRSPSISRPRRPGRR